MTLVELQKLIAQSQADGKLPRGLSADVLPKLQQSLARYTAQTSDQILGKLLDEFKSKIETAQSFTDPLEMRGALADVGKLFEMPTIADKIYHTLELTERIADGAGIFLSQNISPDVVEEYPALEFKRLMARDLPRGFKRGPKGELLVVPEDAWPERWKLAGENAEDNNYTDPDATGVMVALKSSDIWSWLGSTELFDDGTDLNFAPFAWESGYRTVNASRAYAEELGLIQPGDEARPARFDMAKLFPEVGA